MGEFPQEGFEAPLARGEGAFPQGIDGPSDQRELFGFPFHFPFDFPFHFPPFGGGSGGGCKFGESQATGHFPPGFKVPLDQGGPPHCFLRVYLSADSVEILQRISQGTGPRFEASVRPRSSLFTVIPVWRIRVHRPCWVQDE